MTKSSLSKKIIIPTFILLVVVFGIFIMRDVGETNKNFNKNVEQIENLKHVAFLGYLNSFVEKSEMYLDGITSNPKVIEYFRDRDRENLYELLKKSYTKVRSEGKVEQLHFALAPATSFLRFHSPEKYGDDLTKIRETIIVANREKRKVIGPEAGAVAYGYRVVTPLFDFENRHIGTVEVSNNLNNKFITNFVNSSEKAVHEGGLNVSLVAKNADDGYMLLGSNYENELKESDKKISEILKELTKSGMYREISGYQVDSFYEFRDYSGS